MRPCVSKNIERVRIINIVSHEKSQRKVKHITVSKFFRFFSGYLQGWCEAQT